mmetsp:Transcript_54220/g.118687  ORF Transcript_54220/g.118687 Transcript_54220/m.118687 type:complete len:250 (+) Transcript_54220:579-1328(+)
MVDDATFLSNLNRHEFNDGVGHQNEAAVLLGDGLKSGSHVDVGAQVRSINLELRADGALNGPTTVKPETHADAIVGQPLRKLRMISVLCQQGGFVDLSDDLDEGEQRHICQLLLLRCAVIRKSPGEQKCFTDVLVRIPKEFIDARMNHRCDAVHKDHHLILEDFRCIRKVSDITEAEDRLYPPTRDHGVECCTISSTHVLTNNLCTSLSKTQSQQGTNLDDGLFQHDSFHRLRDLFGCRTSSPDAFQCC